MENQKRKIVIQSVIDGRTFRCFALYDTLRRQRRWQAPALFAAILTVSALICFALQHRADQAALLGGVLLVVGLGLPAVYIAAFFRSIRMQEKQLDRAGDKAAYVVQLDEQAVIVTQDSQIVRVNWNELQYACRLKECICLYATPRRAYLLPRKACGADWDVVWAMVQAHMTVGKTRDLAG